VIGRVAEDEVDDGWSRLPLPGPYAVAPLLRFLAAHAVTGVELHDAQRREHTRVVPAPNGPALVTVRFGAQEGEDLLLRLELAEPTDRDHVLDRVRGWLDLGTDAGPVEQVLGGDPLLAPLVAARPGLRVPGSVDSVETALFAVLGQQVSLAAARTFAGRLLAVFGTVGPGGLLWLPDPSVLAAAGAQALQQVTGVTHARARTLHVVAAAAADGLSLDRSPTDDPEERAATRRALLALPGIGPWTADYVALRCLGDPDAYLAGDLVLRRELGVRTPREAELRAQRWRPFRGYALLHLWTAAVFA